MLDDPRVAGLAQQLNRTAGEVAQRWVLQTLGDHGIVVPRSRTADHMAANLRLLDWQLTPAQMASLSGLHQEKVVT